MGERSIFVWLNALREKPGNCTLWRGQSSWMCVPDWISRAAAWTTEGVRRLRAVGVLLAVMILFVLS